VGEEITNTRVAACMLIFLFLVDVLVHKTGPLSAYNLFFKDERIKMLKELGADAVPSDDADDDDDDEEGTTTGTSASMEGAYKNDTEEGSTKPTTLETVQEEDEAGRELKFKDGSTVGDANDESSDDNNKRPPSKISSSELDPEQPPARKKFKGNSGGADQKKKKDTKKKKSVTVGFAVMAKAISTRWKAIDQQSLSRYTALAATEKARYKSEVDAYNLRKSQEMERNRAHLEASLDDTTRERYFSSMSNSRQRKKRR
jgi:hypothetical protein